MTLEQLFSAAYAWADHYSGALLIGSVAVPLAGTIAARIGKAGRTDADGRVIASVLVGGSILLAMLEACGLVIARSVGADVLQAKLQLLLAPLICLSGSLLGIRLVFPLNQLGSVRTLFDVGAFALAGAGIVWFLSKFRGWGIVFFGSLLQLVAVATIVILLMRRLYRRAFRLDARANRMRQI
jgi:hypothetical protein